MSILSVLLLLAVLSIAAVVVCLQQPTWRYQREACYTFALAAALVIAAPLSIALTFSATPLWKWMGSILGASLVGRAGPPIICYVGMLVACVAVLGACSILLVRSGLGRRKAV